LLAAAVLIALLAALALLGRGPGVAGPALAALRGGFNFTFPSLNFSVPEVNLSVPAVNLSVPALNLSCVSPNLTTPHIDLATPALNLTTPALNLTTPALNLSVPPLDLPPIDPAAWEGLAPEALLGMLSGKNGTGTFGTLAEALGPWMEFSGSGSGGEALTRPGELARMAGQRAEFPMLIVPGVTTTGLELWESRPCAQASFKQRLWGSLQMLTSMAMSAKCWKRHMQLDEETGLDPPGVRVRAASGLEAVEYLLPGFWVWGQIVENLADVGYDSSNLQAAPYDWRLAPSDLEARDAFFTRMALQLEGLKLQHGRPAVVVSHSYGDTLVRYFMRWVEAPNGGRRGRGWVNQHLHAYVPIAGPMLGTPKAISAMLAGETSDTSALHSFSRFLKKQAPHAFINPDFRAGLLRSWGSGLLLLPQGGEAIWGTKSMSPSDGLSPFDGGEGGRGARSQGTVLCLNSEPGREGCEEALTVPESLDLLHEQAGSAFRLRSRQRRPPGRPEEAAALPEGPLHWASPFTPLPYAPTLRIFCLYGTGLRTEMAYNYQTHQEPGAEAGREGSSSAPDGEPAKARGFSIDSDGVLFGDGDGTVPLVSLGYLCVKGWRDGRLGLNPGGGGVVVREFSHAKASGFRGSGKAADHVDILGNHEVISDILAIATGRGDALEDRLLSNITEIAARIGL
jgi:phospholipid:diacylglycerol acyltransferase